MWCLYVKTEKETAGPSAPVGVTRGEWVFLWIGYGMSGTADPSASPDFLSRVAASVDCMWFSLRRTT